MSDTKATILIIDDIPQNLDVASYILEENGYTVLAANNGATGIKIAKKKRPDLILLDVMMPDQDGFETCKVLKDNDETMNIPVIFMSALTSISDKSIGFSVGGVDYITKPIQPEEVLLRVNLHIELNQLKNELIDQNELLEKKVRDRTYDLEQSNNLLNSEIAKRYEIESDLIRAKEKAEYSDKLKSEFLAQMSHEIRTPINAILSLSSLLMEYISSEEMELKEIMNLIDNSGKRIIRTIDLLINMSELQAGTYECIPKTGDLVLKVIDPLTKIYKENYNNNNNELVINLNCDNPFFKFDEYSVYQILDNILNNAFKFTMDGVVTIDISRKDDNYIVEIKDTGIGINKSYINNLFRPFSQEEQGYSRKFEGNGLGLALVKRYCEINNIDIKVSSEKNKGTTVTLFFLNIHDEKLKTVK